MNWITFAIALWVMFGLELGLKDALELGSTGAAPSFVMTLLVVVAMSAPKRTALAAALLTGALLDLTRLAPTVQGASAVATLGPYMLGCALGVYAVLTMRAVVIRRHPLSLLALTAIAYFLTQLVVGALFEARSWYDPQIGHDATRELLRALGSSIYTGVLAAALGPLLMLFSPLFAFEPTQTGLGRRPKRA